MISDARASDEDRKSGYILLYPWVSFAIKFKQGKPFTPSRQKVKKSTQDRFPKGEGVLIPELRMAHFQVYPVYESMIEPLFGFYAN